MEGPMEGLEPDVTENEVSTLSRNLFKLEKAFENNPNAMKICNKVCIQKWKLLLVKYIIHRLENIINSMNILMRNDNNIFI